jgi:hypothetical protein
MTVRMDDEKQKQIRVDLSTYKHIDYGYAVTSQGSQGLGAYRTIINANAYEGAKLLNERMGYVADSRAERDVTIYTNSIEDLPYAIARTSDKELALDAKLTTEQRRKLIEQQRAAEIEQRQAREINVPSGERSRSLNTNSHEALGALRKGDSRLPLPFPPLRSALRASAQQSSSLLPRCF